MWWKVDPIVKIASFSSKLKVSFLVQCMTEATQARGTNKPSVLDYVFVNEKNLVDSISYESPVDKRDHVCLT